MALKIITIDCHIEIFRNMDLAAATKEGNIIVVPIPMIQGFNKNFLIYYALLFLFKTAFVHHQYLY